jgi:glucose-6-phosphate 1-dehydrogenase
MTPAANPVSRADALILFGATGDLAFKKIFPALQSMAQLGQLDLPVIAVTREGRTRETLLARARESVETHGGGADDAALGVLASRLQVVAGEHGDPATYRALAAALGERSRPLFYLAIPPSAYAGVVAGLGAAGCARGGRVLIEKPFGRDLASARALDAAIHRVFDEAAIFRLDHYAGKRSVQNVALFRFANAYVERFWNRDVITAVKITMAEAFGVAGRGRFYEEAGAIRDVLQNHLLLVTAVLAMEPPAGADGEALREAMVKAYQAMRPLTPADVVRGQVRGYRAEAGVAPDSTVETYAAVRLFVDSPRWAGVPFFIRTGKSLAVTANEVVVELRAPPRPIPGAGATRLRFGLGPEHTIALDAPLRPPTPGWALQPGELRRDGGPAGDDEIPGYRDLLLAAIEGLSVLFTSGDAVQAQWRVVEPVLDNAVPVVEYEAGSWGPAEAARLTEAHGGWSNPGARPLA